MARGRGYQPRSGPGGGGRRPRTGPPGWDDTVLPLPAETWRLLEPFKLRRPDPNDNLGLWLDKLVRVQAPGAPNLSPKDAWSLKAGLREFVLKQFCQTWESPTGAAALRRQQETIETLPGLLHHRTFTMHVNGRLLVDYGRSTTAESTLSFHHIWGVPRIPSSALKGAVRAWLADEQGLAVNELYRLFGDEPESAKKQAGTAVFFDALPLDGRFTLDLDVITPHYKNYYTGNEPPADWLSPEPHTFLTVVDTTFVFFVGIQPRDKQNRKTAKQDIERIGDALREALQEQGIGAKRSVGYGRFLPVEPQ